MASFKVHAGDWPQGVAHLNFGVIVMPPEKIWQQWGEKLKVEELESVEVATEDSVKRLGGAIGWGVVGGTLLGPVGLLAGLLLGGRGKEVCFVAKFRDGRKLLATCDAKLYQQLLAKVF